MPLTLAPLADSRDLAVRLGVADDDLSRWCVSQISAEFRGATGNDIILSTDTLPVDSDGTKILVLPVAPLIAVTSVTEAGLPLVAGTDFEVSKRNGLLRRLAGKLWPVGYEVVEVVCTHGYRLVPDEIQAAVLDEAAILYSIQPGIAAMTVGNESTNFAVSRSTGALGLSDTWVSLVNRYTLKGRV